MKWRVDSGLFCFDWCRPLLLNDYNIFQHIFLWRLSYSVLVGKCFRAPYAQNSEYTCKMVKNGKSSHRMADLAVAEKTRAYSGFLDQKTEDIKNQSNNITVFVNWSQLGCQRDRMDLFSNCRIHFEYSKKSEIIWIILKIYDKLPSSPSHHCKVPALVPLFAAQVAASPKTYLGKTTIR